MTEAVHSCVVRLADAEVCIPGPPGDHFVNVVLRGSLRLLLSHPLNPNRQAPHAQDEIYFVVRGSGFLFHDGKREVFGPGDVMFVAAGVDHRFEDFTDDLAIWVAFYGPPGGDVPA